MRAASRFVYGDGKKNIVVEAGDEIPRSVPLDDIPETLVLEKLASDNPDALSREQLLALAGIGVEEGTNYETSEDDLREALGNLRTKGDVVEWMEEVRPSFEGLDPEAQTRAEMVDVIIEELLDDD